MLIASYEDWYERTRLDLQEANPEVDCPCCDGNGHIEDTCDCCGSELGDDFCDACEGTGTIPFNNADHLLIRNTLLSRRAYFQEVIRDLKRYCAYTGADFLDAVTPFVKEQRKLRIYH